MTLTFIFEISTKIISFYFGYLLMKQNEDKQIGNRLLALGIISVGFYTLFTFTYSIIAKEWATILFLKLGTFFYFVQIQLIQE